MKIGVCGIACEACPRMVKGLCPNGDRMRPKKNSSAGSRPAPSTRACPLFRVRRVPLRDDQSGPDRLRLLPVHLGQGLTEGETPWPPSKRQERGRPEGPGHRPGRPHPVSGRGDRQPRGRQPADGDGDRVRLRRGRAAQRAYGALRRHGHRPRRRGRHHHRRQGQPGQAGRDDHHAGRDPARPAGRDPVQDAPRHDQEVRVKKAPKPGPPPPPRHPPDQRRRFLPRDDPDPLPPPSDSRPDVHRRAGPGKKRLFAGRHAPPAAAHPSCQAADLGRRGDARRLHLLRPSKAPPPPPRPRHLGDEPGPEPRPAGHQLLRDRRRRHPGDVPRHPVDRGLATSRRVRPLRPRLRRGGRQTIAANVLASGLPPGMALNVNIPPPPIKGVKITRLGWKFYDPEIIEKTDPRNSSYFWIGTGTPRRVGDAGTDVMAAHRRDSSR